MDKKPPAQARWNIDTGELEPVPTKATESPQLERQASLLDHAADQAKAEAWWGEKEATP